MTRHPAARALVALLAGTAIAGCGVPTEPTPRAIPRDAIPLGLLTTATPSPPVPSGRGAVATIYLVRDGTLVGVRRDVPALEGRLLLAALLAGPSPAESRAGLRSAVAPRTNVNAYRVEGSTAHIDVTKELASVGADEQMLAIAEIVYAVTGDARLDAVTLSIDGAHIPIPRADGTLTDAPVTRAAYSSLLPSAS